MSLNSFDIKMMAAYQPLMQPRSMEKALKTRFPLMVKDQTNPEK